MHRAASMMQDLYNYFASVFRVVEAREITVHGKDKDAILVEPDCSHRDNIVGSRAFHTFQANLTESETVANAALMEQQCNEAVMAILRLADFFFGGKKHPACNSSTNSFVSRGLIMPSRAATRSNAQQRRPRSVPPEERSPSGCILLHR